MVSFIHHYNELVLSHCHWPDSSLSLVESIHACYLVVECIFWSMLTISFSSCHKWIRLTRSSNILNMTSYLGPLKKMCMCSFNCKSSLAERNIGSNLHRLDWEINCLISQDWNNQIRISPQPWPRQLVQILK